MEYTAFATETINGTTVHIYNTINEPLLLSITLGTLVNDTRPSVIIKDFNKKEKVRGNVKINNQMTSVVLLTRAGVRKFFVKAGKEMHPAIEKYINISIPAVNPAPIVSDVTSTIAEPILAETAADTMIAGTAFIGELLKDMFNDKEFRMLGTIEEPLFVARDMGDLLGIVNIRESIKNFDEDERVVGKIYICGGLRETILLTEDGLYRLLGSSNKPEAHKFQKWVSKVIKEIRLKGSYDIKQDIERWRLAAQQMEQQLTTIAEQRQKQIAELESRLTIATAAPQPPLILWDLNEFDDKPCVYLFHLRDYDYKFGQTSGIIKRETTHRSDFRKYGCSISIAKLWTCVNVSIMKTVEARIKVLARTNGWLSPKYDKHEIITCPDINIIITRVDAYIKELSIADDRVQQRLLREHEIRIHELEIRKRELDIECYKLQHIRPATDSPPAIMPSPIQIGAQSHPLSESSEQCLAPSIAPDDTLDANISVPDVVASVRPDVRIVPNISANTVVNQQIETAAPHVARIITCAICKQSKLAADFRPSKKSATGHETKCKGCRGKHS